MQASSLPAANDWPSERRYYRRVVHSRPKRFTNWYLREWLATLGVSQATLAERSELGKTAVSLLYNDRQDYTPQIVQVIAETLNIAPYELLMHPDDANALKQLRNEAVRIVEVTEQADAERAKRLTAAA